MRENRSIDGFVPRRPSARLDNARHIANRQQAATSRQALHSPMQATQSANRSVQTHRFVGSSAAAGHSGLTRSQIDQSLQNIESAPNFKQSKSKPRRQKLAAGLKKTTKKTWIKRLVLAVLAILVIIGAYVGIQALLATSNMFQGNMLGIFTQQPLKTDANGRSNILVFGTAEDSEGGTHEGGNLTDSIMVLSVNQEKKDAYMLSLPRDLWVQYENTCTVGNEGKLNAVYFCGSNDGQDETAGATSLQNKIGDITGLDIQYFAHVNFTVVTESVDAVGGIDVTVESEDPRGILDRNFDWKCNYECHYVKYENGERAHMDGEHALAFMRSRNAQGGYGLPNGNFDRERNQQKVIVALRDKALSAGTLTNIGAVTGLIDAMGNNLRTNFQPNEIRTLMSLAKDISTESIVSLSLANEEDPLVTTGMYYGQSIVRPILGVLDYSDIRAYVRDNVAATPLSREKATIAVFNGTETAGLASRQAENLEAQGFKVGEIGNAADGSYDDIEIYQLNDSKPETTKALKSLYKVEIKSIAPPVNLTDEADFVIIYGREPASS